MCQFRKGYKHPVVTQSQLDKLFHTLKMTNEEKIRDAIKSIAFRTVIDDNYTLEAYAIDSIDMAEMEIDLRSTFPDADIRIPLAPTATVKEVIDNVLAQL